MRIEIYYKPEEKREADIIKAFVFSLCKGIPLDVISKENMAC